jgi:hypothetical protein
MFETDAWQRLTTELKNLFPLFRYLILQTETHAFCLALAAAALLGFFHTPFAWLWQPLRYWGSSPHLLCSSLC